MSLKKKLLLILIQSFFSINAWPLPDHFVYLHDVDSSIQQDIRYAKHYNFIGHPLQKYNNSVCILTLKTAKALQKAQKKLQKKGYSLKVYDCYRPKTAVEDIWHWSQQQSEQQMKTYFYPRVNKQDLFKLQYIARHSSHSRGSTVDLTIVPLHSNNHFLLKTNISCYALYPQRQNDNSIDMGTNFDCLDRLSHYNNRQLLSQAQKNRKLLHHIMKKQGFKPYQREWWHFTLKHEPFPQHYFDFPVE